MVKLAWMDHREEAERKRNPVDTCVSLASWLLWMKWSGDLKGNKVREDVSKQAAAPSFFRGEKKQRKWGRVRSPRQCPCARPSWQGRRRASSIRAPWKKSEVKPQSGLRKSGCYRIPSCLYDNLSTFTLGCPSEGPSIVRLIRMDIHWFIAFCIKFMCGQH